MEIVTYVRREVRVTNRYHRPYILELEPFEVDILTRINL
ncbi:unnamed protein product, partial [Rotaria sp. Silwood1]